jgi:hypothetical protein
VVTLVALVALVGLGLRLRRLLLLRRLCLRLRPCRGLGRAGAQRRRWPGEPAGRCIGARRMIGGHGQRARSAAGERRGEQAGKQRGERPRLHDDLPIEHIPAAMCCACVRSSCWSFATSSASTMSVSFAPPSMSLAVALEWIAIIPWW